MKNLHFGLKTLFVLLFVCAFTDARTESFEGVKFKDIRSSKKDKVIEYVYAFPFSNYKVYYCKQPGYFYLDPIDDVVKNVLRHGAAWEPFMNDYAYRYARLGSVAIDVGAHIGTYTLTMARTVGVEGRVIAIEPQPKVFRELVMNMSLNQVENVDFYLAGAGDRVGEIELSPPVPGSEGATGLGGGTGEYVDLITIDSLHLDNVSFIKIDAEWMENVVLDGAKETIARNRPVILIEIMGGFAYETAMTHVQARIDASIRKLENLGYNVERVSSHDYLATPL